MPVLEGFGDEVVFSIAVLFTLLLLYLCYMFIYSATRQQVNVIPHRVNINEQYLQVQEIEELPVQENTEEQTIQDSGIDVSLVEENVEPEESTSETIEKDLQKDDDMNVTRQKRLEFFRSPSNGDVKHLSNGSVPILSDEPELTSTDNLSQGNLGEETLEIRLKYLDDTERLVHAKPSDTILDFKRSNFQIELSNSKTVRLIYHGQVLQDDRTVTSYGLTTGCCIHVQVINRIDNDRRSASNNETDLDLSQFLWPLLGVLLGVLWMFHFQYREYFATSSTVALFGLSGLFLTVVWGQYTSRPEQINR